MIEKDTILVNDTRFIYAVNNGKALPLINVMLMPTDYIRLFEMSLVMLKHIETTRQGLANLLEVLEVNNIDQLTPMLVSHISASKLVEEGVVKGVAAMATKLTKKS